MDAEFFALFPPLTPNVLYASTHDGADIVDCICFGYDGSVTISSLFAVGGEGTSVMLIGFVLSGVQVEYEVCSYVLALVGCVECELDSL